MTCSSSCQADPFGLLRNFVVDHNTTCLPGMIANCHSTSVSVRHATANLQVDSLTWYPSLSPCRPALTNAVALESNHRKSTTPLEKIKIRLGWRYRGSVAGLGRHIWSTHALDEVIGSLSMLGSGQSRIPAHVR